jgi:hypothetical protein
MRTHGAHGRDLTAESRALSAPRAEFLRLPTNAVPYVVTVSMGPLQIRDFFFSFCFAQMEFIAEKGAKT